MPYNTAEFAAEIKAKYPEYSDWEDGYLVGELTSKYPEYKEWVSQEPQYTPIPQQPAVAPPALAQQNDIYSQIISAPRTAPAESTRVAMPQPKPPEQAKAEALREQYKTEYLAPMSEYRKGEALPPLEYEDWVRLKNGQQVNLRNKFLTPELIEAAKQGLKEPDLISQAGQKYNKFKNELTGDVRDVFRTATGLGKSKEQRQIDEGYAIQTNAETEKHKSQLKQDIASGKNISAEDTKWLEQNDKGIISEIWQGVKDTPGMIGEILTDKKAFDDLIDTIIADTPAIIAGNAAMGAAGGAMFGGVGAAPGAAIGTGVGGVQATVGIIQKLRQLAKIKSVARRLESQVKAGKITSEKSAATMARFLETQGGLAKFDALREIMLYSPYAGKEIAKEFAKNEVILSGVQALSEKGLGDSRDFTDIFAYAAPTNILPDAPLTALTTAVKARGHTPRPTAKEFDNALGTHRAGFAESGDISGNTILDVGTQGEGADRSIKKSVETLAQRPDIAAEIKELSNKKENDFTAQEQYRFLDEEPESYKEAASQTKDFKEGKQHIAGFREDDINNITPTGNVGTITHETLHGLESHPELMQDLAEWKESVKQWARDNNVDIPEDRELVAQTFAHRLGYPEPASKVVDKIPVPDELLRKMSEAAGTGEGGLDLRGETMPELSTVKPSMEEARQNVPEEKRRRLSNIWDKGIKAAQEPAGRKGETSLVNNKNITIGKPSEKLNKAISQVLGEEVNAKQQSITLNSVKHINDRHGVGKETDPSQMPITKETFMLIPDVLDNFDSVERGTDTNSGRSKSVKISKHYSDGKVVIADAVVEDNGLEIRTMWLKKPTAVRPRNAEASSGSRLSSAPFQDSQGSSRLGLNRDETKSTDKESAVATNYSSAARKGIYRTNPATHNIQKNPPPSNVSREKSGDDVRFSLSDKEDPHVWHGSPHSFTEFSHDYMGTGEGAQAYGWGTYFTDKREIAKAYAKSERTGDGKRVSINGEEVKRGMDGKWGNSPLQQIAASFEYYDGDKERVRDNLKTRINDIEEAIKKLRLDNNSSKAMKEMGLDVYITKLNNLKSQFELLEAIKTVSVGSNLYKAKIKGGKSVDELNFIHWDKPLTESQRNKIVNDLEDLSKNRKRTMQDLDIDSGDMDLYINAIRKSRANASEIYGDLSNLLGSPREASKFLNQIGIDGVQYPTEYKSKGSHDNSYNYVIFDDKAINIAETIRFSLAETAGVPENHSKAADIAKQAKKEWQEKGVESRFFKRWFGDSKVVDEDGKPVVVYHRTDNKFTVFDKNLLGKSSNWETANFGFYFANKNEKGSYGKKIMRAFLNIKNPYEINVDSYYDFDMDYRRFDTRKFQGHDGVVINIANTRKGEADKVYIAFSPEQIKSATDNRGTFDSENPDIRFSLAEKYTPQEREKISNSNRIEIADNEQQVRNFVDEAIKGDNKGKKILLGKVDIDLARRIAKATKVNVNKFNLELRSDDIKHLIKQHGDQSKEAPRGQRAITADDILKFVSIVQNFDTVRATEGNGLTFTKNINGRITAVTLYADGNKSLSLKTMYADKSSGGFGDQATNAKDLRHNAQNDLGTTPANNNIEKAIEDRSGLYTRRLQPLSTNKYTKNSGNKQDESENNTLKYTKRL